MSVNTHRRNFMGQVAHLTGWAALAASGLAQAQGTWPSKPVRIVVPVGAGGTADILTRTVAEALQRSTGQAFLVDLKPGANGAIASHEVMRLAPDGYNLLMTSVSSHAMAQATIKNIGHGPDDFTPIGLMADANAVLLVSPKLGVKSVKELLDLARSKPGVLNYYSTGVGSYTHLMSAMLESHTKVQMTHVPYKGFAQALPDLINGTTHVTWDAIASAMPYVKDGRLTALAVSGPKRASAVPDLPTMNEVMAQMGLPSLSSTVWIGLAGPRGMSPELTRRINEELNKAMRSPEALARYAAMGLEPVQTTPAEYGSMWRSDVARWAKVVQDTGIKVE